MEQLGAPDMTVVEILEKMDKRKEYAARVGDVFAKDESPVRKLSEAKRGNTGEAIVHDNVDKVFALTLMEEIKRTKASVKRFAS